MMPKTEGGVIDIRRAEGSKISRQLALSLKEAGEPPPSAPSTSTSTQPPRKGRKWFTEDSGSREENFKSPNLSLLYKEYNNRTQSPLESLKGEEHSQAEPGFG